MTDGQQNGKSEAQFLGPVDRDHESDNPAEVDSLQDKAVELAKAKLRLIEETALRNRIEREFQESRTSFINIVEKSSDGIVVVDAEGSIRYGSPSAALALGMSPNTLIGRQFGLPLVCGGMTAIDLVSPNGEPGVAELRTEEIMWDGTTAYLVMIRDVTDRKRAERKILRQRTLLEAVNGAFRQTLSLRSPEKVAKTFLKVAQSITGCECGWIAEADPKGKLAVLAGVYSGPNPSDVVGCQAPPEDKDLRAFDAAEDSPEMEPSPSLHVPIMRAGELSGVVALGGKPGGFTAEDIADVESLSVALAEVLDRNQAEEALRESELRFRQLAENIEEILWLTYPGDLERLAYVSPAHETLCGTSCEEVIGKCKTQLEFIHHEDREAVSKAFNDFIAGRSEYSIEFRIVRPHGAVRWMWDRGFRVVDENGRVHRIAGITEDITQRKRQEERQHDVVEELKNFAYVISHDLRAPLINLKGYSGELRFSLDAIRPALELGLGQMSPSGRAEVTTALEQDIPEALEFIGSSVTAMADLTNAILQLSRLGRRELKFEELNMQDLTHEAVNSFAYQLSHQGTTVETGALPNIVADRICLEQIVSNLVSNDAKYVAPSRPGRILITGHRLHDEFVFRVEDNGRGIHPSDVRKIFDMFRRVGPQDVPGEGMGLAFVRTLVWRHGGRIWCESTPGVGSSFVFTIPTYLKPGMENYWEYRNR